MSHHEENEPHETPGDERAVVRRQSAEVARPTGRAVITAEMLQHEGEQRKLLGQYVKEQMIPDVDFGVIPGTAKKTLLKPGAEKLCGLFHCVAEYTLEDKTEDWERGLFNYRFTCRVVSASGCVVAEGVGSCSSYEKKYRFRNADRKCPNCGKSAIIKGKAEYGGGWLCFKKKDGCGAKYPDNAPEIVGQESGQVENPEWADLINTILKMAKKRSLVDAAISLARCSDLFTQDVEEFQGEPPPEEPPPQTRPAKKVSRKQVAELIDLVSRKGMDKEKFIQWATGKEEGGRYEDITTEVYEKAVTQLKNRPDKQPAEAKT